MNNAQSETIALWAEKLGAGCFLNALIREWHDWTLDDQKQNLRLPLRDDTIIAIPLKHYSAAGRHLFDQPYLLKDSTGKVIERIGFMELVNLLVMSGSLWEADNETKTTFIERVARSVENTGQAISARSGDLDTIYAGETDFQQSEQSLFSGHSVHPTPKSRDQFSDTDSQLFIPEFAGQFQLHWFSIRSDLLIADSVHELSFDRLTAKLAEEDPHLKDWLLKDLPKNHTLLPAHPWQAQRWMENAYLKGLMDDGCMISYGKLGNSWRATSSVRAVHADHASFMLKYSLSVKLTNSMRHLLPKEVIRGKEIHQVKYGTETGAAFRSQFPDFDIITEPAHAAIMGVNGDAMAETMMVLRENPFNKQQNCKDTELLATLTQDSPEGESRIVNIIRRLAEQEEISVQDTASRWFGQYLTTVVEPLIGAQSQYGLLFGAHQQNLLIHMPEGYPQKAWFRDCQGTGYSQLARKLLGHNADEEQQAEHHVEARLGNRLFTYYLLINSTFGVLSAIGSTSDVSEQTLIDQLHAFLTHLLKQQPADSSCLEYMLNSSELWSKGNFYCTYSNYNENTMNDPLAIYHPMPNPLFRAEPTK